MLKIFELGLVVLIRAQVETLINKHFIHVSKVVEFIIEHQSSFIAILSKITYIT